MASTVFSAMDGEALKTRQKLLASEDLLANKIKHDYCDASIWRADPVSGIAGKSYRQLVVEAEQQISGYETETIRELNAQMGVNLPISITRGFTAIAEALFRNAFKDKTKAPFFLKPTEIPDLSPDAMAEVRGMFAAALSGADTGDRTMPKPPFDVQQSPDQIDPQAIIAYARQVRQWGMDKAKEVANVRAERMNRLVNDQIEEGDYYGALWEFAHYFFAYPIAISVGPITAGVPTMKWNQRTGRPERVVESLPVVQTVHPIMYYPSRDTVEPGKGTFDIIRETVSLQYLRQMVSSKSDGIIAKNVKKCIEDFNMLVDNLWLLPYNFSGHDSDDWIKYTGIGYQNCTTATILRYFGRMERAVLEKYDIDIPEGDSFECEVVVLRNLVLRIVIRDPDLGEGRPVCGASYETIPNSLCGYGLCQQLNSIERGYAQGIRCLFSNAVNAATIRGEVNASRIAEFMDPNKRLLPGLNEVVPVDDDLNGKPAFQFYKFPEVMQPFMTLAEFMWAQGERLTGLTGSLAGQSSGSGANRNTSGMIQLTNNSQRMFISRVYNMDKGKFEREGQMFYYYNMLYSDDPDIKADCKAVAQGVAGSMQQIIDQTDFLNTAAVLSQLVPPDVMQEIIAQAVKSGKLDMGITIEQFNTIMARSREDSAKQQQEQAEMMQRQTEEAVMAKLRQIEAQYGGIGNIQESKNAGAVNVAQIQAQAQTETARIAARSRIEVQRASDNTKRTIARNQE